MGEVTEVPAQFEKESAEFVAIVGSPNSGKSTLFNWLTGRNQKVVNYPGSTVDMALGPVLPIYLSPNQQQAKLTVIDTPGTYSLFPKSPDEEVALKAIYDLRYKIAKVILVIDATQLSRQWHMLRQIQEAGFYVVVALTMHDLYQRDRIELDLDRLGRAAGAPICLLNGYTGEGLLDLLKKVDALPSGRERVRPLEAWTQAKTKGVFDEAHDLVGSIKSRKLSVFRTTENWDRILLHPVWGMVLFLTCMTLLFSSIYWMAQPLMEQVEVGFAKLDELLRPMLGDGLLGQFVSGGLLGGLGSVLVFVPQIFILFLGVTLLEESGYLARAATLVDRPLAFFGLNGKAFVPLLSGFACAVPAMMAARSIQSPKVRWLATFIIPFMTCSARLPVYALLIGFLLPGQTWKAGMLMAGMYFGALVLGAVASAILSRLVKFKSPSYFLMELPLYRRPKGQTVLRNSLRRTNAYIRKTGPIILVLSIILWTLSTFPNYREPDKAERLQTSYATQIGHWVEPVFRPMGVDWRVGVGLISAFAAREVFVSSMAVLFHVTDEDEAAQTQGLTEKMRSARMRDGQPVFTTASVVALLVFFMIALQCISTSATAKQEMGSTRFAVTQLVVMNVAAYLLAVLTYNLLA